MQEFGALKIEIGEAVSRRLVGDGRSEQDLFALALAAIGEVTADMIFAAAKDQAHAESLLLSLDMMMRQRWAVLAGRPGTPETETKAVAR